MAPLATAAAVAIGLAIVLALLVLPVINALKGKWWFALFAMAGGWLGVVGAIRLAKPHSYWARHWYGEAKMARTMQRFDGRGGRFPGAPPQDVALNPQDSEPWPDQDPATQDKLTRRGVRR
jgi:hypothetical protein